jgi:hypothetical protein
MVPVLCEKFGTKPTGPYSMYEAIPLVVKFTCAESAPIELMLIAVGGKHCGASEMVISSI